MNRNDTGISKGIDVSLIWLYLLLVMVGIMAIFAVTYKEGDAVLASFFSFKTDYSKQMYYFFIAFVLGIFILLTDSKFFTATANIWYALGIVMLLLVFPFHSRVKGTESIIRFGGFQFQPAEFCKVCVCLALAKYLSLPNLDFSKTRSQLIAAGIVLLPSMLTILQSETGLALVYFSFFIVMYREGLPATVLVVGFSLAALVVATLLVDKNVLAVALTVVAALVGYIIYRQSRRKRGILTKVVFIWIICVGIQRFGVPFVFKHVMQPYQVERIFSTIGRDIPEEYQKTGSKQELQKPGKKDVDYNVKQSKIAIGSGGFTGKGLLKGTQTRYDFVPEQRTDFIFCTIGEGFGFIGTTVLLGIYMLLLFRIVAVAERQRSVFSRCYAYGVAAVLFFHVTINICMTIGLAPVIGIPLPFISYGGTALLTFTILLFILIRLDADRQMVLR
ncbi:rod shape-determining protein RodA [Flavisolibacter ginsengisoli]|jgi:rod shape determining protein RodA|uniref:Cell wall polymerase n=1 Tax=Flavisolibacter ginsengisoli DSM 18119 TaxID=1121884 RepID=A0A1M4VRH3_9BACT|nr:rod shape-determining protein RodA [Flavisolibacter ginsengisoli]SHE71664.1 rod shape determining protein RodA [Flavisolibacter ginsengisoli DSM 18119]